jgi:hypothetical protein
LVDLCTFSTTNRLRRSGDSKPCLQNGAKTRRLFDMDSLVPAQRLAEIDQFEGCGQPPGRQPGDWTKKTADGQTWGWDPTGIRLGKFTIPNAILAALPLRVGSGQSPVDARNRAFMYNDIQLHAQQAISEDEFRDAVRRIRERKEKERREKEKTVTADGKGSDR